MKHILTIATAALLSAAALAAPVSRETARQQAQQLMGKTVAPVEAQARSASQLPSPTMGLQQAQPAYYLFAAQDGEGFAIISADDALPAVVAFSTEGTLTAESTMPPALALHLDAYAKYVEACQQGRAAAPDTDGFALFASRRQAPSTVLVPSQWGQQSPYNDLCPQQNGKTCPTGCVATAMAQIMYYWQWPVKGSGYGSGTGPDGNVVHGTIEHTYQWEAMQNTTAANRQSAEAATAVAQLLYDCGLSVGMDYGVDGSSAGTPFTALYRNFGYIPTTLRTRMRESFATDVEYLEAIADEIDAGRPVYQAASSESGTGTDASGHAYIIDGYDTNGLVHVNWGWNGNYDGYYNLALMNPGSYSYTLNQRIITGIEPAWNGETGEPTEYPYLGSPIKSDVAVGTTMKTSVNFNITVGNIWNNGGTAHVWNMTFALFDVEGNMLETINANRMTQKVELSASSFYKEDAFTMACKIRGTYNGDYAIRTVFKEGSSDWILPDTKGGQDNNAIYVHLSGANVTFTDGTDFKEQQIAAAISKTTVDTSRSDNRLFDLQGRRVQNAGKGIYIIGGKKVVK